MHCNPHLNLGGATATHVRIGDPFLFPLLIGVMIWSGLYLRDSRLRAFSFLKAPPVAFQIAAPAEKG